MELISLARMTEHEPRHKKRRVLRILIRIFSGLVILIALLILSAYILFNFFGTKFLREMIQKKIYATSQGLYTIDFSDLKINIFTRNISIYNFRLTPDTLLYQKLKNEGKAKKTLYKISYRELILRRINFREIWINKNIHLREMSLIKPEIVLMGFPDTLTSRKGRFKNVYEDVYPLASVIFREIQIDSIYVERARIISGMEGKPGKQAFGQYEFSAVLRDVAINPFSYYNHERVFYSRDIDFKVHNVKYSLTDSLYFIEAEEIGFNLKKSRIYGKNISLRPNFFSRRLSHARQGTFFQVDVPEFAIDGINLYAALTDEQVHLKKVILDYTRLKIFHNTSEEARAARLDPRHRKKQKPFNKADLFTVISGKLRSVQLDTLIIREASLEYFRNMYDRNPELRVARMDIAVEEFRLDSLASKRKDRIFYAKDFDLNLNEIVLRLRDQVHILNAGHVYISTKKKIVDIEGGMLYPDETMNLQDQESRKNTISVLLPDLQFNNIDLVKAFQKQDLVFSNLVVESPDVRFTRYRPSVNKEARFRKPGDFFEESNEDVVYDLLKKYVNSIRGDSIIVNNGFLGYHLYIDNLDQKISSGAFDLKMYEFLIDSVHGMNQQGYFYSKDFDFDIKSFNYISPDSLRQLKVSRLHISTKDSLIEADSISFDRTREPLTSEIRRKSNISVNFTVDNLFLQGLNHKKLFLEKVLQANLMMLDNPQLSLKAGDPVIFKPGGEDERIASSQGLVKFLNISKLIILKGDISFDGLERIKSSYFKLKDIDFSIQNLGMRLPDRGKMNGSMRFDSINLSVTPLRMIVMDSTYEVRCDNISLNSYPLDIEAKGVSIVPLMHIKRKTQDGAIIQAKIPRLSINDFYFDKALFERKWIIRSIVINNPEADVSLYSRKDKQAGKIPLALSYNQAVGSFSVDSILIKNARAKLHLHDNSSVKDYSVDDLQVSVMAFLLDSMNRDGKAGVPLFNAADISVSAKGRSFILKDSFYTLGFTKVSLSTGKKNMIIDSLSIIPNYPGDEFYKKLGYQMDIFSVSVPRIELFSLELGKLISQKSLYAKTVIVTNPHIETYRDKRIKRIRPGKRYLLQAQIRKIPIPLTIDTVILRNGYTRYEEQTGNEPGRIFFDRMNASLLNLSNDTAVLKKNRIMSLDGTSRFMGKGRLSGHYRFDMINPRDSVWWIGTIDSVDLKDINPMLTKVMPAKISHGFVDKAKLSLVLANDATAVGSIELYYRDLYVELSLIEEGSFKKLKNELITDLANLFLPDENPDYHGKLRKGIIYFNRDTTKGFFNYVWKSTLSGLKSSVGFNSQVQMQIKKNLKRKAK
ncbi:MAG: hypothetical protein NTY96_12410 [Bacteroidetes bacterium]|nr:hypothetical protein [Bacteroidota bacterium]